MIQEFPLSWPRTLDFLPVLSLQRKVAGNLDLYYFYGTVSTPKPKGILERIGGPGRREIETDLGIKARISEVDRKRIDFKFREEQDDPTSYEPRNLNIATQREILDNIISVFGIEAPEVAFKARGAFEGIPTGLQESLQGVERLFHYQIARFTPHRLLRKLLGIPSLQSPLTLMRPELLMRKVVTRINDPVFRRFRSTNVTDHILFHDGQKYGQPNTVEIAGAVQQELSKDKWWQDLGLPEKVSVQIPGEVMRPRFFRLQKMQRPYAVLW